MAILKNGDFSSSLILPADYCWQYSGSCFPLLSDYCCADSNGCKSRCYATFNELRVPRPFHLATVTNSDPF